MMVSIWKVWLTTVLASPVLFWVPTAFQESEEIAEFLSFLPILLPSVLFGFLFSIPTMGLFYLLNQKLHDKNSKPLIAKVVLSLVMIVGILTTFNLVGGSFSKIDKIVSLPTAYLFCALTPLWFSSVHTEKNTDDQCPEKIA
ncbi:hypothetical protein [Flavobacterium sp.]|uniref:hypothetical protein n=1 Tax=Flavobacterium sp. TaxID=239 RepID=UPI0039E68DCF